MATKTQINSLITRYIKLYESVHGHKPILNRYKAKWGFEGLIEDNGYEGAGNLIEYYFANSENHDVNRFLSTYDEIKKTMDDSQADREHIQRLMEETQRRVHEQGGTGIVEFGLNNERLRALADQES